MDALVALHMAADAVVEPCPQPLVWRPAQQENIIAVADETEHARDDPVAVMAPGEPLRVLIHDRSPLAVHFHRHNAIIAP